MLTFCVGVAADRILPQISPDLLWGYTVHLDNADTFHFSIKAFVFKLYNSSKLGKSRDKEQLIKVHDIFLLLLKHMHCTLTMIVIS